MFTFEEKRMKRILINFFILFTIMSCKSDKKDDNQTITEELSTAEKIANANGFENWNKVTKISFTFNVDRDSTHFERSWIWKPKNSEVRMISSKDTIRYNRASMDSTAMNFDRGFINDKYWLLAPFQLVWDKGTSISLPTKEIAPMSKTELNKITLTYTANGGYTPGDAYDFYYNDDYMIKEWVYREGNSKLPSMTTTWEDYEDFNGIRIARTHKKSEGNWTLYFTGIKIDVH